MKSAFILLVAASVCIQCGAADAPRFKSDIVCFNGGLDSRSSCAVTSFQPDGIIQGSGKMGCGFAGRVSEIEWTFVERHGDKDVYRFTRHFPADSEPSTTMSKNVEFSDRRVVVFQDTNQVVVIQPPKEKP